MSRGAERMTLPELPTLRSLHELFFPSNLSYGAADYPFLRGEQMKKYSTANRRVMKGMFQFICICMAFLSRPLGSWCRQRTEVGKYRSMRNSSVRLPRNSSKDCTLLYGSYSNLCKWSKFTYETSKTPS